MRAPFRDMPGRGRGRSRTSEENQNMIGSPPGVEMRGMGAQGPRVGLAAGDQSQTPPPLLMQVSTEDSEFTPPGQPLPQFNIQSPSPQPTRPPVSRRTPTSAQSGGSRGSSVGNRYPTRLQQPQRLSFGTSSFTSNRQQPAPHDVRARLSAGSAFSRPTSPSVSNLRTPNQGMGSPSPRLRLSTGSYQPFGGQRFSDVAFNLDSPSMPRPAVARTPDYDTNSESDTSSVKEPFTNQVDSLNRLLTSPDRGLGPLAQTSFSPDVEDDYLDDEMKGLEESRNALQRELSKVDYSILEETPDNSPDKPDMASPKSNASSRSRASARSKPSPNSEYQSSASEKSTPSPLSSSIYKIFGFRRKPSRKRRKNEYVGIQTKPPTIPDDASAGSKRSAGSRLSAGSAASNRSRKTASSLGGRSATGGGAPAFQSLADFSEQYSDHVPSPQRAALDQDFFDHDPFTNPAQFFPDAQGRPHLPELTPRLSSPMREDNDTVEVSADMRQQNIRASLDSYYYNHPTALFPEDEDNSQDGAGLLPKLSSRSDEEDLFRDLEAPSGGGTANMLAGASSDDSAALRSNVGTYDAGGPLPSVSMVSEDEDDEIEVTFTPANPPPRDLDRQLSDLLTDDRTRERIEEGDKEEEIEVVTSAPRPDEATYGLDVSHEHEVDLKPSKLPSRDLEKQLSDILNAKSWERLGQEEKTYDFDASKMPTSYATETTLGKSGSSDSSSFLRKRRHRRIMCYFCILFVVLALAIFLIAFFFGDRLFGRDDNPDGGGGNDDLLPVVPTAAPLMISEAPSEYPSAIPTVSAAPSISHSPTGRPTYTPKPTSTFEPSSRPSSQPSPHPSSWPSSTPSLDLISFETRYSVIVENGLSDSISSDVYVPDLIESMDLLSLEVDRSLNGDTRRRLASNVLLPSNITMISEEDCPVPNGIDRCELIAAQITLIDADDYWHNYKLLLDLAIQIGRLQFHLDAVNPDSVVEILDRFDGRISPEPSPAPSGIPTSEPTESFTPTVESSTSVSPTVMSSESFTPTAESLESVAPTVEPSASSTPNVQPSGSFTPTVESSESFAPIVESSPSFTPSFEPSGSFTPIAQPSGSFTPTAEPSISITPTAEPSATQRPSSYSLFDFLVENSFDEGAALKNGTSPQHQAFTWLSGNKYLDDYSEDRILQRYAMATFYYSSHGDDWFFNTAWLSDDDECDWYNRAGRRTCGPGEVLERLELDYNNLNGVLPPELAHLSKLERMVLRGGPTSFTSGTIPTEFGYLTDMTIFFIQSNIVSGNIPTEFGMWKDLQQLDVSNNRLTGSIPTELGSFDDLLLLNVGFNELNSELPSEIGDLAKLQRLFFQNNLLSGPLPSEIGQLRRLQDLNGSMNMFTSLPSDLGRLTFCDTLNLHDNVIQGTIPTFIGSLDRLRYLDLSRNALTGTIPTEFGELGDSRVDRLDLSFNHLSGPIPSQLGRLDRLRILMLQSNRLAGAIPSEISHLIRLTTVRLDTNDLSGTLPNDVCESFNTTRPAFYADCSEFYDNCPCCTTCCVDEVGCECRYTGTDLEYLCFQQKS